MAAEQEIVAVTQKLLNAIAANDLTTYKELCDPAMTCFEPESLGHLVEGIPFHKFFFDNLSPPPVNADKPHVLNTMAGAKVQLLGADGAVVAYTRLTQKMVGGAPITVRSEETRVWQKKGGKWVHVHFHKSVTQA
eukprot:CAMPEP_0202857078 /NCGR_PEP_ID=MMETSP1391-20130828/154_1 /ASSEMBLY_ACC=CAM_ASM_000867 /TAXON_ID=1034604 /ORGANISM="Chlamydomonas leiostraca, Strain SAG 11-49" /LENGTH=134 /DNA_ID=CAMNT_0049535835 /DNA_START=95 /DNA_END=499 /DNA_ORIENTATION=-